MLRDAIERQHEVNVPEALMNACRREIMLRSRQYLQRQFDSPDSLKTTLALMKQEAGEKAERKARARMILLTWAEKKGLRLDENAYDRVLAGRAARRNMDAASYRLSLARSGELFELRAGMLEEKALDELMKAVFRP